MYFKENKREFQLSGEGVKAIVIDCKRLSSERSHRLTLNGVSIFTA